MLVDSRLVNIYIYPYHIDKHTHIYMYICNSEHKDQNDVKKNSKYEINFYFKVLSKILSGKNKDIKLNYLIPKYKEQ